jgi:hypothetical protein
LKAVGVYNVVAFRNRIYGVPQSLGAVDWYGHDVASMKGVVTGRTEQEVLQQLHGTAWSDDPRLLRSVGTYNIVAFHDKIYGVPQSLGALGAVDWLGHDVASMKGVVTGRTEQEVLDGLPRPK